MHGGNCPCGQCGAREAEWRRTESQAIDAAREAVDAGFDNFIHESISDGCADAEFDGDPDDNFRIAALTRLIETAATELLKIGDQKLRRQHAQWIVQLAASEAGLRDSAAKLQELLFYFERDVQLACTASNVTMTVNRRKLIETDAAAVSLAAMHVSALAGGRWVRPNIDWQTGELGKPRAA